MSENLVIQTAFLGDLFLSLPLLKKIRELEPERELSLVCRSGLGEFFLNQRIVDHVYEVDKKAADVWRRQVAELRTKTFHHIICPHESPRTAWLVYGLKAEGQKIGFYKPWNGFFFDRRVRRPKFLPDALRQMSLLTAVSSDFSEEFSQVSSLESLHNQQIRGGLVDFRKVKIPDWAQMKVTPPALSDRLKNLLPQILEKANWPGVLVAPGSIWATKRWTIQGYTELVQRLVGRGYDVVLIGSQDEKSLCDEIVTKVPEAKNFSGEFKISETLALMAHSLALVANDSGAVHLASSVSLPTVAIFGPTTLDIGYRPWQENAIVVQKDLRCRPCGKHGASHCPLGTHDCMKSIGVDEVLMALKAFNALR